MIDKDINVFKVITDTLQRANRFISTYIGYRTGDELVIDMFSLDTKHSSDAIKESYSLRTRVNRLKEYNPFTIKYHDNGGVGTVPNLINHINALDIDEFAIRSNYIGVEEIREYVNPAIKNVGIDDHEIDFEFMLALNIPFDFNDYISVGKRYNGDYVVDWDERHNDIIKTKIRGIKKWKDIK